MKGVGICDSQTEQNMADSPQNDEYVAQDETYVTAYDVYRRGLLEQQKVWVSKQVIPILSASLNRPCFRILAVGTGEGDVDMLLLAHMVSELQTKGVTCEIQYNVIERNASFIARFQDRVKESAFDNVKFAWHHGTYEEVVASNSSLGTFNLIHFFHSLYYMEEKKVLEECMEKYLESDGCILCVVQTEVGIYTKNCRKYKGKLDNCLEGFNVLSDENLKILAAKNGWNCKVEVGKRILDLTSILGGTLDTPEGSKLFDFFFHAVNLVKQLKEDQLKEILDFFKSNCTFENGKYLAVGNEGIVFFFKS